MMKRKKGLVLELFILLMPAIIAVLGLVVDAGLMMYYQHELDMSTEAASVATISAYDRPLYDSSRKVRIDPMDAKEAAIHYLKDNFSQAKITSLEALSDNAIKIKTEYTHNFVFMRLFGFDSIVLQSECTTIGG